MLDIDSLNKTNLNFIEIEKILSIKITNHTRICSLLNSNRNYIFFKLNFENNHTLWGINSISDDIFFKFIIDIPFITKKINNIINYNYSKKKKKFLENSFLFASKKLCLDFSIQEKLPSEFINAIINFINTSDSIDNLCIVKIDENEINITDENSDDIQIRDNFVNYIINNYYNNEIDNDLLENENDYVIIEKANDNLITNNY